MSGDQNKTEKPTPHKLKEAKNKGQVSKSTELNAIITLVVFVVLAYAFWQQGMLDYKHMATKYIVMAGQVSNSPQVLGALLSDIVWDSLAIILPFMGILMLVGVMINIGQTGFILTAFPLKPDFTKMNPGKSLKKIFSKKTLFELFKSTLKICLFGVLIYMVKENVLNRVLAVYYAAPSQMADVWSDLFFQLAIWMLCFLIPVALIDYAYTNWDFMQQMMMSTRDVKDEHKKREGDPEIKQKQKQIQKELAKKAASLGNIKDADVVITNPTHIAVALRYRHEDMGAPMVMAMGKGSMAQKIKHIARLHQVPIVQNKMVARKLYKDSVINGYIPYDCYNLVAPIFKWIMELKGESVNGST